MSQPELTATGKRMKDIVDYVNSKNLSWKAEYNPEWNNAETHHLTKNLMDAKFVNRAQRLRSPKTYAHQEYTFPKSFNSRDKWPQCTSLFYTRDQSNCGSCWAVSSGSVMSDRLCIESNQQDQTRISEADILSCCTTGSYGCDGGEEDQAFATWVSRGYSTGGAYGDTASCKPYPFQRCAHHGSVAGMNDCGGAEYPTPSCKAECTNSLYTTSYSDDIHRGASYSTFHNASDIAEEISRHGPVVTGFTVYEDFMTYKSGIYEHATGDELGGHAVRIIGYGTENGQDYWIVTNSWNEHWGEAGIFRIVRGTNHCGFEEDVVSGHSVAQSA